MEGKSKIREVLRNEITVFMMFASILISVVFFFTQIQQNVALLQKDVRIIEENHIKHIEEDIDEICKENEKQNKKINSTYEDINNINVNLERIRVLLEKK